MWISLFNYVIAGSIVHDTGNIKEKAHLKVKSVKKVCNKKNKNENVAHPTRLSLFRSNTAGDKYCCFSLNSESCIRETPLQQEKSKLCFSPSLDKGQQMPAELLSRVLRKRIFSTSFLWQPDEKTSIRVSFLFNRKKGKTAFCSNTNSKFILTLDHL